MASGYASVDAMDRLIKNLTGFMTIEEQLKESVKKDYEIAGSEWNDEKYKELESAINDITSALSASYVQLSNCQIRIQVLRRALIDYLNT